MTYESPIIKIATLACAFNGKVLVRIGEKEELIDRDQAVRFGNDLYDAAHKVTLENIP